MFENIIMSQIFFSLNKKKHNNLNKNCWDLNNF